MSEKYAREAEIKEAVEKEIGVAVEQKTEAAVIKLLERGVLTDQEIAEDLEMAESAVKKLRQQLESSK